ncbi:MAG TPA: MFS transporter [Actinomycetota bacterium]|nr:MFS transporter [Actinomycetota bacterium]
MSQAVQAEQVQRAEGYDRRWWILGVLCFSLLIIVMDNTIVNVALPTLVRKLHATESQLQWTVDIYSLMFAGLLLTMGTLGDRFGRGRTLAIGLGVFGLGSLASSFAGSSNVLILTRGFTGIGAALIMPATLSILTNVFPPEERAKAIGIWAGVSGLAVAIGPVIGGLLLVHFWWGSIFLINVPVCAAALVAGRLLIPNSRDLEARRLDPAGAALSIVGIDALVWGIIEAPNRGWTNGWILAAFGFAAVVLAIFIAWELRSSHPMLNVKFFRNPRFTAANISITLVFFALFGSIFFLTQYLQFVLGYSPLQAGVRLVPLALVMLVLAPIAGQLVQKLGSKAMVGFGMALGGVGLWYLGTTTTASGYAHVVTGLVLVAAGLALSMVPATDSIMGSLPPGQAGVGSAMNDTTREIGGALGVAILGSILSSRYGPAIAKAVAGHGVPAAALGVVKSSVGGAIGVGQSLVASGQAAAGHALIASANSTFITSMNVSLKVGAGVAVLGALVSALWLPNRPREQAELAEGAGAGAERAEPEAGREPAVLEQLVHEVVAFGLMEPEDELADENDAEVVELPEAAS